MIHKSIVRSSAAEYLTFVAATGSVETSVEMRYEKGFREQRNVKHG